MEGTRGLWVSCGSSACADDSRLLVELEAVDVACGPGLRSRELSCFRIPNVEGRSSESGNPSTCPPSSLVVIELASTYMVNARGAGETNVVRS